MTTKDEEIAFEPRTGSDVSSIHNGFKDFSLMSHTKKKAKLSEKLDSKSEFTLFEKVMIVIGSLGISINVCYSNTVCSSISSEFEKWYSTDKDTYYWFTQAGIIIQVFSYIPAAYLFSKYLKLCVQFTVFSIMFGTSLKLVGPRSNIMLYIGQFFIQLAAPYAYVATAQIGSLIFNQRGTQIFIATVNITPFFLNIFFVMYPPYASRYAGSDGGIVGLTHRIG